MIQLPLPAYIGPGAGFAFLGSLLALVSAVVAGFLSVVLWPFRMAWSLLKRPKRTPFQKAIFLGFGGLDPAVTEKLMAEGSLPNLARLRDQGSYRRLRTTFPAASAVAWATFATGVNPAKHNVFDAYARDPKNYLPAARARRGREPFWKILGRHAIRSTILQAPGTFPPESFHGRMLCEIPELVPSFESRFAADGGELKGPGEMRVPFRVRGQRLEIQGDSYPLAEGQYTPWIRVQFGRAKGVVRFLLLQSEPGVKVYVSPLRMDPANPSAPISHPRFYARYLAKLLGSDSLLEPEALLLSALRHTRRGVVACVFDAADEAQHVFYGREESIAPHYRNLDRIVGEALGHADSETAVFVLSDHGFCAFRRGVNVNSWLLREGYLALQPGRTESDRHLGGVDWTRTRAYAFGRNGVYVNLRGREGQGIVRLEDAGALRKELAERLGGLADEKSGAAAIQSAHRSSDLYHGPYLNAAPDIVIGYAAGYRASLDAEEGKVTQSVFEDNLSAWRGDHAADPSLVPGVLFSNLKISADSPGMEDLAPTALTLFGVKAPPWMEGRSVVAVV